LPVTASFLFTSLIYGLMLIAISLVVAGLLIQKREA
jgi:hypothetical protein